MASWCSPGPRWSADLKVCSTCCYGKQPCILPCSYRITSGWLCSLSGVVTSALWSCPRWSLSLARPDVVSRGVPWRPLKSHLVKPFFPLGVARAFGQARGPGCRSITLGFSRAMARSSTLGFSSIMARSVVMGFSQPLARSFFVGFSFLLARSCTLGFSFALARSLIMGSSLASQGGNLHCKRNERPRDRPSHRRISGRRSGPAHPWAGRSRSGEARACRTRISPLGFSWTLARSLIMGFSHALARSLNHRLL